MKKQILTTSDNSKLNITLAEGPGTRGTPRVNPGGQELIPRQFKRKKFVTDAASQTDRQMEIVI